jgi:hypothetical protein
MMEISSILVLGASQISFHGLGPAIQNKRNKVPNRGIGLQILKAHRGAAHRQRNHEWSPTARRQIMPLAMEWITTTSMPRHSPRHKIVPLLSRHVMSYRRQRAPFNPI